MAVEDDVTLGEVVRRFDRFEQNIQTSLRDIATNSVSAAVWAIEKRTLEEREAQLGREIADLRGELDSMERAKKLEHEAIDQKIALVRQESASAVRELQEKLDVREREVKKERAQRLTAIGLAVLAAILGIIGTVTAASINTALNGIAS